MRAKLVATSIDVQCPKCGESAPNADGAFLWSASELWEQQGWEKCRACGVRFDVAYDARVVLPNVFQL